MTSLIDNIRRDALAGRPAVFRQGPGPLPDPDDEAWAEFTVPGAELADLIHLFPQGGARRGIGIVGVCVRGDMELMGMDLDLPLMLVRCQIVGSLSMREATVRSLNLAGTVCRRVSASGLRTRGEAVFTDGFTAHGGLDLRHATIDGHLATTGARLGGDATAVALNLDLTTIGAGAFLDRTQTEGRIVLRNARVEGTLNCRDSILTARPVALDACGISVGGDLRLDRSVVRAPVWLVGATVGGQLACDAATLHGLDGEGALVAQSLTATGGVFIEEGTTVRGGGLRFANATVGGQLRVAETTIEPDGTEALDLEGATLAGGVKLGPGLVSHGELRLSALQAAGQVALKRVVVHQPDGVAIGGDGAHFDGGLVVLGETIIEGSARFHSVRVGNQLSFSEATFSSADDDAMSLDGARVDGDVFFDEGVTIDGGLRMIGATVLGDLVLKDATVIDEDVAFDAQRLTVRDSVYLGERLTSRGRIVLRDAKVGAAIVAVGATIESPGQVALDLMGVAASRVGVHRTVLRGALRLDGLVCEGDVMLSCTASARRDGVAVTARSASISGALRMRGGFSVGGKVDLRATTARGLDDEARTWPAEMDVTGFRFASLDGKDRGWRSRRDWLRRQVEPSPKPYLQLAAVYRDHGDEAGARKILMERHTAPIRRDRPAAWRADGPPWWRRVGRQLLRLTIGHGYAPWRVLYLLVPLLTVMSLWYAHAEHHDMLVPTRSAQTVRSSACTDEHPCVQPVVYAIDTLVPVLDLGQRSRWATDASDRGPQFWDDGRWLSLAAWVTTALGWALTTLIVAGFSGVVRRD